MDLAHADKLSEAARKLLFEGAPAYQLLVVRGAAGANPNLRRQLEGLTADKLLARPTASREHAEALLAGCWLWHDFLDESHTISQGIESPTGSFWHAIMHRREGDFSNAKYWYARCRNHPALAEISTRAAAAAP